MGKNKLHSNTWHYYRSGMRGLWVSALYFAKGIAREFKIASEFFNNAFASAQNKEFNKKWLKRGEAGEAYYDFNGIKVHYDPLNPVVSIYPESFYIFCNNNDNYEEKLVRYLSSFTEGPHGFTSADMDVTVKEGDIVIDAGSWVGDFSAYVAFKGAKSYAFEPTPDIFKKLSKTAELNKKGAIVPINKGLGDKKSQMTFYIAPYSASNSFNKVEGAQEIEVEITTIDDFVREEGLERVDFIKADIEGFERYMLKGARETLKKFAPKLALCTYHLPDDPDVMERIILEANPAYTVVQLDNKLYAQVL